MKFKLLPLFIILVVVVSFVFCGRTKYIQTPDRMIVYNKGISKEIDRNSPEFNKIVESTQKRFHKRLATARDGYMPRHCVPLKCGRAQRPDPTVIETYFLLSNLYFHTRGRLPCHPT